MAHQLHLVLAAASTLAVLLVAIDAGARSVRSSQPGPRSSRLVNLSLLLLAVTSASGLGLMAAGSRPHELYHLMYGGFAFLSLPVAGSLGTHARGRGRNLATVIGALFALTVIARLFATG